MKWLTFLRLMCVPNLCFAQNLNDIVVKLTTNIIQEEVFYIRLSLHKNVYHFSRGNLKLEPHIPASLLG